MQNEDSSISRIVIKFYDHAGIDYSRGNDIVEVLIRQEDSMKWKEFIKTYPFLRIDRIFTSIRADELIALVNKARTMDIKYHPPDLLTYFVCSCPAFVHPGKMILKLAAFDEVELVYLQSAAINPQGIRKKKHPVFPPNHLNPSPEGINAKYARGIMGGMGSSQVKFIDIEQGWDLNHHDFDIKTLPLTGINHPGFRDHGTAVLRTIMKKDTGNSCMGITPGVSGYVISQWRPGGEPNDADAVLAAITSLNFGDILLLETQTFYSAGNNKVWPAEIQEATFQAIRLATALGIIVIEAAGNGDTNNSSGNDLDDFLSNKKRILNPVSRHFKDSGAILVAASIMDLPHNRIGYSNYGKRINCYAWGEGVVTGSNDGSSRGYGIHPYITDFNGTSSASAIIAGVVIAVQSISEMKYHIRLSPGQMRHLVSNDHYGTASANGRNRDKIGVMPDLERIIDHGLPVSETLISGI
jgi:hypothetical protein